MKTYIQWWDDTPTTIGGNDPRTKVRRAYWRAWWQAVRTGGEEPSDPRPVQMTMFGPGQGPSYWDPALFALEQARAGWADPLTGEVMVEHPAPELRQALAAYRIGYLHPSRGLEAVLYERQAVIRPAWRAALRLRERPNLP